MTKFSLVIPVFNGEKTIRRLIDSILKSNYENYEIVVIDNCSTDLTKEIVVSFNETTDKVIYKYTDIKGVCNARNIGISCANGEFVLFPDADDEIDECLLFNLNKMILNDEFDIISYSIHVKMEERLVKLQINKKIHECNLIVSIMLANIFHGANNKCYNKQFLLSNALKFDNEIVEDIIFNCQAFGVSRKTGYCENGIYYLYRTTGETLSTKYFVNKHLLLNKELLAIEELAYIKNIDENEGYIKFIKNKCFYQSQEILFNLFRKGCDLNEVQIKKVMKEAIFDNSFRYSKAITSEVDGCFNKVFLRFLKFGNVGPMYCFIKILNQLKSKFPILALRMSFKPNNKRVREKVLHYGK